MSTPAFVPAIPGWVAWGLVKGQTVAKPLAGWLVAEGATVPAILSGGNVEPVPSWQAHGFTTVTGPGEPNPTVLDLQLDMEDVRSGVAV